VHLCYLPASRLRESSSLFRSSSCSARAALLRQLRPASNATRCGVWRPAVRLDTKKFGSHHVTIIHAVTGSRLAATKHQSIHSRSCQLQAFTTYRITENLCRDSALQRLQISGEMNSSNTFSRSNPAIHFNCRFRGPKHLAFYCSRASTA
jgi:hypothetical protein